MSTRLRIELGDRAKDLITGFSGIVVADMDWLYGCRRLTLQPEALKDGMPQDRQHFDEPQLEVVGRALHPITPPSDENLVPRLGDRGVDTITKVSGIVCTVTHWLHGCVFVTLQPEGMKDKKPLDSHTFDYQRIKITKAGAIGASKARPAKGTYGPRDDARALSRS